MRDKGPNLTGRKLAKLTPANIVLAILAKAGVIQFTRLVRVAQEAIAAADLPYLSRE